MSSGVTESLVGRVLDGRYRVQSHIADGGMASVYLALDTRLDRDVALKVLRGDLAKDEAFVSRFRREARSAARLSHPHVVAVFDQGEDDGHMFLAMEYVAGQTLREVMQTEGPLTPRAALDIIDPVLQALGAAHRAGIIHRDVKPENVILREEDGTVKVADFGLARAVTTQTTTSQTGVLLGTVAYLSPEQVERGIADARSDVYAAGLILFEMLTGTKAFTGETAIHVAYQHVHSSVPAPSSRVGTVPAELDRLVALATSRDPDQRPADAAELLAQVRASRATLTPAELDRRPQGKAATGGGASTVAVARTTALPLGRSAATEPAPAPAAAPQQAVVQRAAEPPAAQRRGPWRWVLAALLLLAAAAAGAWYFMAGPGSPTLVPRVVGQSFPQAEAALTAAHLDATMAESFDETVKKGLVISTDPGAGTEVGRNTDVTVTVSKGPERYAVPKLLGSTRTEAEARLSDVKLVLGKTSEAYDEKVPAGQILRVTPKEGTPLKRGAAVAIVVSKGRQPIQVQDFTGKPADHAVTALTDDGLQVDATQQEFSDTVAKGSVISQSPSSGTLYRGDQVKLVVSKGPPLVEVPDVTRKQEAEATKILTDAGFQVKVERFMGGIFGTVRSQDPAAGSKHPKGTVVTLVVV